MTSGDIPAASRFSRWWPKIGAGLFWSWNIIFLAFMLLGFAPTLLPEMLIAARGSLIPPHFVVYGVVLVMLPVIAVILGFTVLRGQPRKLFALGYGVIDPLLLLLALRFFVIRQATAAVSILLIAAALGVLAFLWHLLDRRQDERGLLWQVLRVSGLTLLVLVGIYASIWIGFYAVPLGAQSLNLLGNVLESLMRLSLADLTLRMVPFTILGGALLIYSATLFILVPVAIPLLYGRAWWASLRALSRRAHPAWSVAVPSAVAALLLAAMSGAMRQPQVDAFALLETPPASPEAVRDLIEQEETIREGLLNSYLAPQRYVGSAGDLRHVSNMYQWGLGLSNTQAESVQNAYERVARPVLYEPVGHQPGEQRRRANVNASRPLRAEPPQAAKLYQDFFDTPITEGEHDVVVDALRATWSVDLGQANWQTVADREIWLARQELNVTEHGDWAEVELYEVYENQTVQRQEVVTYFTLPESAVITGVWLGNSADRDERFVYRVAPRGAAQATYQSQVRRNVDPALVEQIGPSQYRLRIFPIEPMDRDWEDPIGRPTLLDAPQLHMWLTWQVMADGDAWPMPYLARKFNVYWDSSSERLLNGEPMAAGDDLWLPSAVPASLAVTPLAHRVDFPDGQTVLVAPADPVTPDVADLKLAVVLDRSRSMNGLANTVTAGLTELGQKVAAVDVYLTSSSFRGEAPYRSRLEALDLDGEVYFGGQNAAELLDQFAALQNGEGYDAVLVVTDGTGYEAGDAGVSVPIPNAPVWMVHLNGRYPIGYDDGTLEAIQASGGGAAASIDEVLSRLHAGRLQADSGGAVTDLVDGYTWTVLPDGADEVVAPADGPFTAHSAGDPFAAFAARRVILAEMLRHHETLAALDTLDALHGLATDYHIVTPYSSMIVLVTDFQHQTLDRLEARGDRFQREYEEVGETEADLTVNAVPEPEEWLLIIVGAGMLGYFLLKKRERNVTARAV